MKFFGVLLLLQVVCFQSIFAQAHSDFDYQKFIIQTEKDGVIYYDVKQEGIDARFSEIPKPISYIDFNNKKHKLHPWYSKHVVYLTEQKNLDLKALYLTLAFTDMAWEQYGDLLGQAKPALYEQGMLEGHSTIAVLAKATCENQCSKIGKNGIELTQDQWIYPAIKKALEDHTLIQMPIDFYKELGKNFAVLDKVLTIDDKKHQFNSQELMAESMSLVNAVYMLQAAKIPTTIEGTLAHHNALVLKDLHAYLTDKEKTVANTILQQQGHKGGPNYNLMRSFLFFVAQNYGGYDCLQRMWKAAQRLEVPTSPQAVLDNYFLLVCFGAQQNLEKLFAHNFKYEISDKTRQLAEEFEKSNFSLN